MTYCRFIRAYLTDIGKVPLLSAAEESELSKRVHAGDVEALNKLIESNLRFVVKIATKYRDLGLPLMDLIGDGNLGLIQAAKRFDANKQCRFTTYAIWWIKQSILSSIARHGRAFPLSARMIRILRSCYQFSEVPKAESPLDRQSAAKELDVGLQELENILSAAARPVQLDGFDKQSEDPFLIRGVEQKTFLSPEAKVIKKTLNHELQRSFEVLTPIQQRVLRDRFGLDGSKALTLQQIGNNLYLSRERIRQIEVGALKKLKASPRAAFLAACL